MNASFKNITQQVFTYSILAHSFLLPILPRATGICFGIFALAWAIDGRFKGKWAEAIKNKTILFFIAIYLIYLIGMSYTSNQTTGWNNMLLKLSLFLFPIIFFAPGRLQVPSSLVILRLFIISCMVASLVSIGYAAILFLQHKITDISYIHLTAFLHLHPSFFSLYLIFAAAAIVLPLLQRSKRIFEAGWLNIFLVLVFLITVFLLSARQEIIAVFLITIGLALFYFIRRKKTLIGISVSMFVVASMIFIVWLFPQTKMRMEKMYEQFYEEYTNKAPNSVTMRKVIGQTAIELIVENPLIGYGTGDVNEELKKRYEEKNLEKPFEEQMNAHNQFLQTTLAIGIIGLISLLLLFGRGIQIAFVSKHHLYLLFLLLFLFCIITEAMLEAEAGVVFFAFFNTLLALEASQKPTQFSIA